MVVAKVHTAGVEADGKQQCTRCRSVINYGPTYWPVDALVKSSRRGMCVINESEIIGDGIQLCRRRGGLEEESVMERARR